MEIVMETPDIEYIKVKHPHYTFSIVFFLVYTITNDVFLILKFSCYHDFFV